MSKDTLYFCVTTRGNDIFYGLVNYIVDYFVRRDPALRRVGLTFSVSLWGPSLETLFDGMRRCEDMDVMHVLDSDIAPEPGTTDKLLLSGKDIVSSPVFMYDTCSNDVHLNVAYDLLGLRRTYKLKTGIEECVGASFASVCIRRRVLEAFHMAGESYTSWSPILDHEFKHCPPDRIFFAKAALLGFPTFMNWDIPPASHHKFTLWNVPLISNVKSKCGSDIQSMYDVGARETRIYPNNPGAARGLEPIPA